MAKRVWKFVGGPKAARTSLEAAVKAVVSNYEGEQAIYNSETGELFDLVGQQFPPVIRPQYDKMISIFALLLANSVDSAPVPIPREMLPPLIAQIGGTPLEDVRKQTKALVDELMRVAEVTDATSSGSDSAEDQPGSA